MLKKSLFILLSISLTLSAAQRKPNWLRQEGSVILPDNYSPKKDYPLVVVIPGTSANAPDSYRYWYQNTLKNYDVIVYLPPGESERYNYLPDFPKFIGWYESMLLDEIRRVKRRYKIDEDKIFVLGFSLGGDLSWALPIRNPDLFRGAIAMGSRCSYPLRAATASELLKRDYRAVVMIGKKESKTRLQGGQRAALELYKRGIEAGYLEYDGAHDHPESIWFDRAVKLLLKDLD